MPALEFVVVESETALVVDTAKSVAGDALERITVAPIDGTPRSKVVIAVRREVLGSVMKAVMRALDGQG